MAEPVASRVTGGKERKGDENTNTKLKMTEKKLLQEMTFFSSKETICHCMYAKILKNIYIY